MSNLTPYIGLEYELHQQIDTLITDQEARLTVLESAGTGLNVLTADTTFYVDPSTGDDSNDGLTPGAAFLTINGALSAISTGYHLNGNRVIIQLADGTYTEEVLSTPMIGGSERFLTAHVTIQGNVANPENVVIVGRFTFVSPNTIYEVQDLEIQNNAIPAIEIFETTAYAKGTINIITSGGTGNRSVLTCARNATFYGGATYNLTGTQTFFLFVQEAYAAISGATININDSQTRFNFVDADTNGEVFANALTVNNPGNWNGGKKFEVTRYSYVYTGTNDLNYLPGLNAGTYDRTSAYDDFSEVGTGILDLPGPFADDTAAAGGGVVIGQLYYEAAGNVRVRLT